MKLPKQDKVYPNDTNLLSFIFRTARNDRLLNALLTQIEYIRSHPNISEEDVRKELAMMQFRNMPVKANGKLTER